MILFQQLCLSRLDVGNSVKAFCTSLKTEFKDLDINFIMLFRENNFVCNLSDKNKLFFTAPQSRGLILNKSQSNIYVLSPKRKILKFSTSAIGQLAGATFLKKSKKNYKKASLFKYNKFRPRVLGKAMNVCDRPNGGYKHASKILKTFKSQLIKK